MGFQFFINHLKVLWYDKYWGKILCVTFLEILQNMLREIDKTNINISVILQSRFYSKEVKAFAKVIYPGG